MYCWNYCVVSDWWGSSNNGPIKAVQFELAPTYNHGKAGCCCVLAYVKSTRIEKTSRRITPTIPDFIDKDEDMNRNYKFALNWRRTIVVFYKKPFEQYYCARFKFTALFVYLGWICYRDEKISPACLAEYFNNSGQTDAQVDANFGLEFNLRFFWPSTCVDFGPAQIRTQVATIFLQLFLQVDRKSSVYAWNLRHFATCANLRAIWPPIASPYASSG